VYEKDSNVLVVTLTLISERLDGFLKSIVSDEAASFASLPILKANVCIEVSGICKN